MTTPLVKFISVIMLLVVFILTSCAEDSVSPKDQEDYFPINSNFIYTFRTNAITNHPDSFQTFDMKIDEYNFPKGKFLALLFRNNSDSNWIPALGIKDSNNTIYSLGDNPSEGLFPMFKHQYDEGEVTDDEVLINGKKYNAKKLDMFRDNTQLSWWFVDGIGLVKEESPNGVSLFSDDHYKDDYLIKSELVAFTQ